MYGVPSIQAALDLEYPNTTMDEIPGVADPVWKIGTDGLTQERALYNYLLTSTCYLC